MLRKVTIHISQVRLQWLVSYELQITIFQSVEMLFSTILFFINAVITGVFAQWYTRSIENA